MLHAYVPTFDVTGSVEIFLETKLGLRNVELICDKSIYNIFCNK